jgi:hypothetical protein
MNNVTVFQEDPNDPAIGNCFQIAADIVLGDEGPWDEALSKHNFSYGCLAHGMVTRQSDGLTHLHAWVELLEGDEIWCLDFSNGGNLLVPALVYYLMGGITEVKRYTRDEMKNEMLLHWHYGPWEDEV